MRRIVSALLLVLLWTSLAWGQVTIPHTFATRTGSIPLQDLDDNFQAVFGSVPSYTFATLPATCTDGQLARVTDNIRGVWACKTTKWHSITGMADVRDFGAVGDGSTVDYPAVQAAATAAAAAGAPLWFPGGYDYKIATTSPNVVNLTGVPAVLADGATFTDPNFYFSSNTHWHGGFLREVDMASPTDLMVVGGASDDAANVTIDSVDLTYHRSTAGIMVWQANHLHLSNIAIHASSGSSGGKSGTWVTSCRYCTIENVSMEHTDAGGDDGIVLFGRYNDERDIAITNVTVKNFADILVFDSASTTHNTENIVAANLTGENVGLGIYFRPQGITPSEGPGIIRNIRVSNVTLTDLNGTKFHHAVFFYPKTQAGHVPTITNVSISHLSVFAHREGASGVGFVEWGIDSSDAAVISNLAFEDCLFDSSTGGTGTRVDYGFYYNDFGSVAVSGITVKNVTIRGTGFAAFTGNGTIAATGWDITGLTLDNVLATPGTGSAMVFSGANLRQVRMINTNPNVNLLDPGSTGIRTDKRILLRVGDHAAAASSWYVAGDFAKSDGQLWVLKAWVYDAGGIAQDDTDYLDLHLYQVKNGSSVSIQDVTTKATGGINIVQHNQVQFSSGYLSGTVGKILTDYTIVALVTGNGAGKTTTGMLITLECLGD